MGIKKIGKRDVGNKKAQLTVFIILAIVIVAVLVIVFYQNIEKIFHAPTPAEIIPTDCMKDAVRDALNYTMMRGGSANPELYFMYDNYSVEYLCYTGEWYKTCGMQKPLLKQSIEKEAEIYASKKINKCLSDMENEFKRQGWIMTASGNKTLSIDIKYGKIEAKLNFEISLQKAEEKLAFDTSDFETKYSSSSYEIIMIASSIQNYEARYGDSEITTYTAFYPNLKVEKYRQADGTKIYIITDRNTQEKLQFATRSLAWPPGYGVV